VLTKLEKALGGFAERTVAANYGYGGYARLSAARVCKVASPGLVVSMNQLQRRRLLIASGRWPGRRAFAAELLMR